MKLCAMLLFLVVALTAASPQPPASVAIVLDDPSLPGFNASLEHSVETMLVSAGYAIERCNADRCAAGATAAAVKLFAIPQARALPLELAPVVDGLLRRGDALIALDAPAWRHVLVRSASGTWVDRNTLIDAATLKPPLHPLFALAPISLSQWRQSPEDPKYPGRFSIVHVSVHGNDIPVLYGVVRNSGGFNPFGPLREVQVAGGDTVTVFSAKGAPHGGNAIAVMWQERDESKWIAAVPLTSTWRTYRLPASAFHSFFTNTPKQARHGFRPQYAEHFAVVVPFFSGGDQPGSRTFSIAQIGTDRARPDLDMQIQARDILTPAYKFFRSSGPLRLRDGNGRSLPMPASEVRSAFPRPDGSGFDKHRAWRQIAVATAYDSRSGAWRGSPINVRISTRSGPILTSGISDPAFYAQGTVRRLFVAALRRLAGGVFLLDGGASRFTVFTGEPVELGATVVNIRDNAVPVSVRVNVTGDGVHVTHTWSVDAAPHATTRVARPWTPPDPAPRAGYAVVAELLQDDFARDRVAHRLFVWSPPAHPHFVTVGSDGHFHLDGRLWRVNGVNYAPSSVIGTEDAPYFNYYLSSQSYDQTIVDRDLARIASIGMNEITAWVDTREASSGNLLDLLRIAGKYGLHVNLSLRPGMPNDWDWTAQRALIRRYRLAQNDALFAYGVAWEPGFGKHDDRVAIDPAWRRWIVAHYGSVASAQRAWRMRAPRDVDGLVTNPSDAEISTDGGPWTRMVADYRRFADDWLATTYGAVRREIRSVDPHHAVGFRMAWAGDPTDDGATDMPYQFEGLARAMDVLEPEGYGRGGDWDRVKPGIFEIAYARAVAPHTPVFWAETGYSVWSQLTGGQTERALAGEAHFYRLFYRMVRESGSDGVVYWWYPSGYRVNEGTDMGIFNPDGSDRPVTRVIREESARLRTTPFPPQADVWLTFNRDRHANGIYGVYHALQTRYWSAIAAGRHPGLRTTDGPREHH